MFTKQLKCSVCEVCGSHCGFVAELSLMGRDAMLRYAPMLVVPNILKALWSAEISGTRKLNWS